MLNPTIFEDSAFAPFIGMTKLAGRTICHYLIVLMGVKRPDCTGRKSIIVKYTQSVEMFEPGVVVFTEREEPSSMEVAVFNFPMNLIYTAGVSNNYRRHSSTRYRGLRHWAENNRIISFHFFRHCIIGVKQSDHIFACCRHARWDRTVYVFISAVLSLYNPG